MDPKELIDAWLEFPMLVKFVIEAIVTIGGLGVLKVCFCGKLLGISGDGTDSKGGYCDGCISDMKKGYSSKPINWR